MLRAVLDASWLYGALSVCPVRMMFLRYSDCLPTVNAAFAMGNIQIATSAGSEVQNPRVNLPKAMRRVFWRIFFFVKHHSSTRPIGTHENPKYILSLLFVGLLISADDPRLGTGGATASSPFVLAFQTAGIKVRSISLEHLHLTRHLNVM